MGPLSNSTSCSRKPKANSSRRRNKRSPPGSMGNINEVNASKAIDTYAMKQAATTSSQFRIHLWLVCRGSIKYAIEMELNNNLLLPRQC